MIQRDYRQKTQYERETVSVTETEMLQADVNDISGEVNLES